MTDKSILEQSFKLNDLLDPRNLSEVVQAYANCFNFEVTALDLKGRQVINVGGPCSFCDILKGVPESAQHCLEIKQRTVEHELTDSNVLQINSFCGFKHVVFPLSYQLDPIGRTVVGPYRDQEFQMEHFKELAKNYGLDANELQSAAGQVPLIYSDKLKQVIKLLAKIMDGFIFSNAKRMMTTRMHLDTIFETRESTFKTMGIESNAAEEDQAELEKLKSMF